MNYHKKSQLFILSALLLILLLIFTYSLETDNTYIVKTSKYNLLNNIQYETCMIGKTSQGSNITSRYSSYEINVENYCTNLNHICDLTISNNTVLPSNTSLIDYTMFDYHIKYEMSNFHYDQNFTC